MRRIRGANPSGVSFRSGVHDYDRLFTWHFWHPCCSSPRRSSEVNTRQHTGPRDTRETPAVCASLIIMESPLFLQLDTPNLSLVFSSTLLHSGLFIMCLSSPSHLWPSTMQVAGSPAFCEVEKDAGLQCALGLGKNLHLHTYSSFLIRPPFLRQLSRCNTEKNSSAAELVSSLQPKSEAEMAGLSRMHMRRQLISLAQLLQRTRQLFSGSESQKLAQ